MLVGLVIIAGFAGLISYGIHSLYVTFWKPAPGVVSLSAYIVDQDGKPTYDPDSEAYRYGHIKIVGDVYQNGQPVNSGTVRITATTANQAFNQSVTVALKDGKFETEDPAFRTIHPGEALTAVAEVSAPGLSESGTLRFNSQSPVDKLGIEIALWSVVAVLAIVFFYAFTGKKTAFKNQIAIIFSYLIIGIFLAVPIVAPVLLLRTFPEAVDAMIGEPTGLVNTRTPNQVGNETQWALNIGGFSCIQALKPTVAAPADSEKPNAKPPNTGTTNTAQPPAAPSQGSSTNPAEGTGGGKSQQAEKPSTPTGMEKQAGLATETAECALPGTPRTPTKTATGELNPPVVLVRGGLVIPLYVIILSVIGGAINMTRKVPSFQLETEENDFSAVRGVTKTVTSALGAVIDLIKKPDKTESPAAALTSEPNKAAPPAVGSSSESGASTQPQGAHVPIPQKAASELVPREQEKAIDDELDPLMASQIKRNCDTEATVAKIRALVEQIRDLYSKKTEDQPLEFNSFDAWVASRPKLREILRGGWRVELLNQYMYLISAPFLAVVAYYILDLLGLSKQGVVVVLSFSVGLISEKIVSWILGIATGYLSSEPGKPAKAS